MDINYYMLVIQFVLTIMFWILLEYFYARGNKYAAAIRKHRDQRGDDRCWLDDEELYRVLPEGYVAPYRDSSVELDLCRQYIACRHNPNTVYVSPQRRIEELELEVSKLKDLLDAQYAQLPYNG